MLLLAQFASFLGGCGVGGGNEGGAVRWRQVCDLSTVASIAEPFILIFFCPGDGGVA